MADLFELDEFAAFLQQDVDTSSATAARRYAGGLILGEVGYIPTPVPPALAAVGLAVAARAYVNPGGLLQETVGGYSPTYNPTSLTAAEVRTCRRATRTAASYQTTVHIPA